MTEELYIEGQRIELFDRSVSQNFQVNDLADLKDRRGDYTNTIKAPRSPQNISVLDYLGLSGSVSRAPYRKLRVQYSIDGIELISNGYAKINTIDDFIEIVIYSGNISLKETLGVKKLNELNYSDLNHYLNQETYINSFSNTKGYIYGLGDFGVNAPSGTVAIQNQAPSVFVSTLVNKIFTESGYTYSGDIFNTKSFKDEVIPIAKGFTSSYVEAIYTTAGNLKSSTISLNESSGQQTEYKRNFLLSTTLTLSELTLIDDNKIRSTYNGVLDFDIDVTHNISKGEGFLYCYQNASMISATPLDGNAVTVVNINTLSTSGDIFYFVFLGYSLLTNTSLKTWRLEATAFVDIEIKKSTGGVRIAFEELMSENTQESLIKDVMQRYGLIFKSKGNHYEFRAMEQILNDRENAEDWSIKMKYGDKESYDFGKFGRENLFKYKYREIDEIDGKYDGSIMVNNEHNSSQETLITSMFEMTKSNQNRSIQPLYNIPLWETKDLEIVPKETKIKLFKIRRITNTLSNVFYDSSIRTYNGLTPFLSLDNVNMNFFISNYYLAYSRIIDFPRIKNIEVELSLLDIYNLDFFKLKYIEEFGQYFYLNKVSNFVPNKLTKCELVQVVGLLKQGESINKPPQQLGTRILNMNYGTSYQLSLNDFIYTSPQYFDEEFDAPEKIQISTWGTSNTRMYVNGILTTSGIVTVDANNFDLRVQDMSNNTDAHVANFTFKIKSYNSPDFSSVTGTIQPNVATFINKAPIANAGIGDTYYYPTTNYYRTIYPYGCDSYDPDGSVLTYLWTVVPPTAGITLTNHTTCAPTLNVNKNGSQIMNIRLNLKVTDPLGLSDNDEVVYSFHRVKP